MVREEERAPVPAGGPDPSIAMHRVDGGIGAGPELEDSGLAGQMGHGSGGHRELSALHLPGAAATPTQDWKMPPAPGTGLLRPPGPCPRRSVLRTSRRDPLPPPVPPHPRGPLP